MIVRLILAAVVMVVVGLVCILLGSVLATLKVPVLTTIGGFLEAWGWVLGFLAGVWYFFAGGSFPGFNRP